MKIAQLPFEISKVFSQVSPCRYFILLLYLGTRTQNCVDERISPLTAAEHGTP